MRPLVITPIENIPFVQPGDDLAELLLQGLDSAGIALMDGDILVIAQKIISKSENRLINLNSITPSPKAIQISEVTQKDARFIQLVLNESREVLRTRPGTIIVEHKNGYVCANAGIDHSNVKGPQGEEADWYLLLPEDSDRSAAKLRDSIEKISNKRIAVLIIDSHGRAWRVGSVGVSIGLSGMPGLIDLRGSEDIFGHQLRVTLVAAADELAGAASLMMGEAAEGIPAVHVRGFPYPLREGSQTELRRPQELDMFR